MCRNKESFDDLDIKQKLVIITCIAAFSLGWILTIAGFIIPPVGEVADSVLWILGQALLYSASCLSIGMYTQSLVKTGINGIRRDLRLKEEQKEE